MVMARRKHPEQGYRSAKGILDLARQYTGQRLELACQRAIHFRCVNRAILRSILDKKLEERPITAPGQPEKPHLVLLHENLRGADYYNQQQLTLSI